ncbi:MAG TPA: hypothetical protein VLL54_17465 [Pyrinomonadaceae bacterium]|nr:hypothetical protein [Pyrinomonadaceae bacterium]
MARHNGNGYDPRHATETPDVSHIKNVDVTHEASDISVSGVLTFVAGLTVMTVVVFLMMGGLFRFLNAQEAEKEPEPGPMAMKPDDRLPPDPKLQAARGFGVKLEDGQFVKLELKEPEAEYRVLREQWERRLDCKTAEEHESQQPAPNCVSIDRAMEKLLAGGTLRSRESSTAPRTNGVTPPTAWSSGRATGKEQ